MQLLVSLGKQALRTAKFIVKATPIAFPRLVECNVCGWQGKHFLSDRWHKYTNCPKCRSAVRHRLLAATMSYFEEFSLSRIATGKHVLHFAPESFIEKRLRPVAARYQSADLLNPRRDLQLDISCMDGIASHRLDLLIACDVLEHVANDRQALREIARVLKPGGYAFLTVPQKDHLEHTLEDPSVTDPAERERRFGQADHLRIYGNDFSQLLIEAGLHVTVINDRSFPEDMVRRHILAPPELSTHPLATNFRKIYVARKPLATPDVP